ncbi:MAG: lipopolysaccharide heptosyltransferase II [Thermodesulfobacteriota bacterium]|nr:lipopolysaccharide heptosyltransferase II [Thermodesulfobacteriota bacterium]
MKVKNKKEIDFSKIEKILIRSTNWIGDAVLTLPAIASIKKNFPHSYISILCKSWVSPLLECNTNINEVILYDQDGIHSGIKGRLKLARELRRNEFDLAILLQNAFDAALITFLAGIPLRAGYNTDLRGFLLTNKVILDRATLKKHQVFYYLDLLKTLGMDIIEANPSVEISKEVADRAIEILDSFNIEDGELLIGINPGAYFGSAKRWLPERFAQLSDMICEGFHARILLFGSEGDRDSFNIIFQNDGSKIINLIGKTSLLDAMTLIKKCSLFITNDSGLMHLAASMSIPLIAIFGSTDPAATSPLGNNSVILRKEVDCSPCLEKVCPTDHRCMKLIGVDEVYRHVSRILKKGTLYHVQ